MVGGWVCDGVVSEQIEVLILDEFVCMKVWQVFVGESFIYCVECEEEIFEKCCVVLLGVKFCIDC